MKFKHKEGQVFSATTLTQTGKLRVALCCGNEAHGSTERQALKALKNIMTKQGWRVVK
jgi:hypothetical protein